MPTVPFALEQQVAVAAVRRACALTTTIFNKLVTGETLIKGDKSPVTVGDYSAQAVINTILSQAFPEDPIVGEEDATDLRAPNEASKALCARVVELADDILAQAPRPSSSPDSSDIGGGEGERAEWGLGRRWGADALLKAIDRGSHAGGLRSGRMWTLDPIDGTKGFLRGGQYAVCLALVIDARVELGVIGCPNLPLIPSPSPSSYQSTNENTNTPDDDASANPGGKGVLFVAVRGQGAHQLPLLVPARPEPPSATSSSDGRFRLNMPRLALHELSFLESVEKAHAALDTHARVAARLGVRAGPVRMDSQAKYAALVRGDGGGGVYLRLPVAGGGRGGEAGGRKIWDHAPGSLLVEEAGGVITDYRGRPLDFGFGRTLGTNYGVVAARKEVHAQVIEALQALFAEEATQEGENTR
ncbi:3',5'-bisphosphate nucleotidase [Russula decolorans]